MEKIKLSHDNEASWAYLRGWFPSIKLRTIPCQGQIALKSYKDFPQILEMCVGLAEFNKKLVQPYVTLAHIYSQDQPLLAKGVSDCRLRSVSCWRRSTRRSTTTGAGWRPTCDVDINYVP